MGAAVREAGEEGASARSPPPPPSQPPLELTCIGRSRSRHSRRTGRPRHRTLLRRRRRGQENSVFVLLPPGRLARARLAREGRAPEGVRLDRRGRSKARGLGRQDQGRARRGPSDLGRVVGARGQDRVSSAQIHRRGSVVERHESLIAPFSSFPLGCCSSRRFCSTGSRSLARPGEPSRPCWLSFGACARTRTPPASLSEAACRLTSTGAGLATVDEGGFDRTTARPSVAVL